MTGEPAPPPPAGMIARPDSPDVAVGPVDVRRVKVGRTLGVVRTQAVAELIGGAWHLSVVTLDEWKPL